MSDKEDSASPELKSRSKDTPELYKDISPLHKALSRSGSHSSNDSLQHRQRSSRSRSIDRNRSYERGQDRRSRSFSRGRRFQNSAAARPPSGNYGSAGGNNNARLPVIDVTSKFPLTCHFWKNNTCVKGAVKCSYVHGYICRNDINCNRVGCHEIHIKSRRLGHQGTSRGFGNHHGGNRGGGGGGGYGGREFYGGYDKDTRGYYQHNRNNNNIHYGGGGQFWDRRGGRDRSREFDRRRNQRSRERWISEEDRPTRRGRSPMRRSSRSRGRSSERDEYRSVSRSKSKERRHSSTESWNRSKQQRSSERRSRTPEYRHSSVDIESSPEKKSHKEHANGTAGKKHQEKEAMKKIPGVDPDKVANLFKSDMDLSQDTIDKLMMSVESSHKKKLAAGETLMAKTMKSHSDPDATFEIGENFDADSRHGNSPSSMVPPPPPKVSTRDIEVNIPPASRALKGISTKDLWTPMIERENYAKKTCSDKGLSGWEIETPYIRSGQKSGAGSPRRSSYSKSATGHPGGAITAKGLSSELDSLFSNTFDKGELNQGGVERDSIANSDDDGRRRRFLEPQGGGGSGGTSDALSWLMDPSQDTELGASSSRTKVTDAVKQSPRSMLKAATATTSKKRLKSDSSESSSSDGTDDERLGKTKTSKGFVKDKVADDTKKNLIDKKASILENMKMLMEQKMRLDAQKDELSRTHRGSDDILQGILSENSILNEEISKQIQNMCSLVEGINQSIGIEDHDDQSKSKSKKNKKKKSRKKAKKEKRVKESYISDDENMSRTERMEKSESYKGLNESKSAGLDSVSSNLSPVVAPRYWDIVQPLSSTDSLVDKLSKEPTFYDQKDDYNIHRRNRELDGGGRKFHQLHEMENKSESLPHMQDQMKELYGNRNFQGRNFDKSEQRNFEHRPSINRRHGFNEYNVHDDRHGRVVNQPSPDHHGDRSPRDTDQGNGRLRGKRFLERMSTSPPQQRDSRKRSRSREMNKSGGIYGKKTVVDHTDAKQTIRSSSYSMEDASLTKGEAGVSLTKLSVDPNNCEKDDAINRITSMKFIHPERPRNRNDFDINESTSHIKTNIDVKPLKDAKDAYIDQGMHWCTLCNMFYETLSQYVSHLLLHEHLDKLKNDNKDWYTVRPGEEQGDSGVVAEAKNRPLQGAEFLHSVTSVYCALCHTFLRDTGLAIAHLHSQSHLVAYKNHSQDDPMYESSYFKAKMNAYAKFIIGQNQEANYTTLVPLKSSPIPAANKSDVASTKNSVNKKSSKSATTLAPAPAARVTAKKDRRSFFGERHSGGDASTSEPVDDVVIAVAKQKERLSPSTQRKGNRHLLDDGNSMVDINTSHSTDMDRYLYDENHIDKRNGQSSQTKYNSKPNRSRDVYQHRSRWESPVKTSDEDQSSDKQARNDIKSSNNDVQSQQSSIRVVARAYGGQYRQGDISSTSDVDFLAKNTDIFSGDQMASTVDRFASKLDENDKIIEALKKKVASRIQEKRQAQFIREEEEAKYKEKEEREAKKKLEDKLDKLSKRKPVVEEKKSHARFPLIGKMPFFKSKPTKTVPGKSKDLDVSPSHIQTSKIVEKTCLLIAQDIEDPKFSKFAMQESSVSESRPADLTALDTKLNLEDDGENDILLLVPEVTNIEESIPVKEAKIQVSTGSIFGDELCSRSLKIIPEDRIEHEDKTVPEDGVNDSGNDLNSRNIPEIAKDVNHKSRSKSRKTEKDSFSGIIIPGEKLHKKSNKKTKSSNVVSGTESVIAAADGEVKPPPVISGKLKKAWSKSSPAVPLGNIPLPSTESPSSDKKKKSGKKIASTFNSSKYSTVTSTLSSNVPPHFGSSIQSPYEMSQYTCAGVSSSSSFGCSQSTVYGYPPFITPFTTTSSSPNAIFSSYHNTCESPLQQIPLTSVSADALNMSNSSGVYDGSHLVSGSSASLPDYSVIFNQPPPTNINSNTSSSDMILQTSSPIVSSVTGNGREVTPPPPGTENAFPPEGHSYNDDQEEDLLPPGVEAHEVETDTGKDSGKAERSRVTTQMDTTSNILAHVIPTKSQIDSRLIEAGQLSPSAVTALADAEK